MTWKELLEHTLDMNEKQLNTDVSVALVNTANECNFVMSIEFADETNDSLSMNQPYLIIDAYIGETLVTWKELREYMTDMDEQQLNTDVSATLVNVTYGHYFAIGIEFADEADDSLSMDQPYIVVIL